MKRLASLCGLALMGVCLAAALGGCPQDGTTGENLGDDELSSGEKDALSAGVQASKSLGQACNVAKSSAEDDDSSFNVPSFPVGNQEYTFGNCPEVTLSLSNNGLLVFNIAMDFGSSCTPYYTVDQYTCSGSASGTFDQQNQNVNLTFNNVSCNDISLTGDVDLDYAVAGQTITLQGDWDLDYEDAIGPIQTDGEGTGSYDSENYITTFTIFNGTVTDTTTAWTLGLNAVKMSFPTYESFIPYAGEATISGTDIRTIKVKFDANSPTTGKVQVSVGGAPYFEVDLYALES